MCAQAPDIDDRATPALPERRKAGLHAEESTLQDDRHDGAPIRDGHLIDPFLVPDRRIVDQDVDTAEMRRRRRRHRGDRCPIGDIGDEAQRTPAIALDHADHGIGFGAIAARVDDHAGAAFGERQRDPAPDIAPRSGHNGDAALELSSGPAHGVFLMAPRTLDDGRRERSSGRSTEQGFT